MSLLNVQNLKVWFHTRNGITRAVDDVSFHVDENETLAIVGESGSGKSVCCYSFLGLIPCPPGRIESGTVEFQGSDLLNMPPEAMRKIRGNDIAIIFQDPMTCLNPYLTVGEQLIEPLLYHHNVNRKDAKLRAVGMLKEVGISQPEKRFHSFPHEFSGGMRQRVMIAMALITEPRLLICDEPTTALDVTIQRQILILIKRLQVKHNITVIFISHDLGVVAGIADRVLVMQEGKIVESGDTQTLFENPQQPYTQKLLASIPSGSKATVPTNTQSADEQPLIRIENLKVWFKDHSNSLFFSKDKQYTKAVDGVSATIEKHKIVGLVGESGSGKSTLGRALLNLVPVTSGSVYFENTELSQLAASQMKPWRRRMQMIFQDPYASLNPRMTVFQTLAEPLLYHKLATRKSVTEQVLKLMDDVGLARNSVRKYPHEFSGGQRQRIAIGRAIATKPEFIVADEPVSALDVTIQAQILKLILDLVEVHNLTMLFISHDLSVVRYIADNVIVMQQGQLIETGETESVWNCPQDPYTQKLLHAVPIADPEQERQKMAAAYSAGN